VNYLYFGAAVTVRAVAMRQIFVIFRMAFYLFY